MPQQQFVAPNRTWVIPVQQVLGQPDLELCLYTAVIVPQAVQVAH